MYAPWFIDIQYIHSIYNKKIYICLVCGLNSSFSSPLEEEKHLTVSNRLSEIGIETNGLSRNLKCWARSSDTAGIAVGDYQYLLQKRQNSLLLFLMEISTKHTLEIFSFF